MNGIARKNINEILDFTIEQSEGSTNRYILFYNTTDRQGLKRFLLSLIEQEKEHAKRLIELKRAGSPDGIFVQSDSSRIDLGTYRSSKVVRAGSSYAEILSFIIEQKDLSAKLYNLLESETTNGDVANLSKRLADEDGKQRVMAQDWYDLEELRRVQR